MYFLKVYLDIGAKIQYSEGLSFLKEKLIYLYYFLH